MRELLQSWSRKAVTIEPRCPPRAAHRNRAPTASSNTPVNAVNTLVQLTGAQTLVPFALACTLAYLASRQDAPYLWKWALWWGIWALRYVAGTFAGAEAWFQEGFMPATAIASGFLVVWGALQAGGKELPRWFLATSVIVALTWAVQTASGRFVPLSTPALIVPSGYMAACLLGAAAVMYRRDVLPQHPKERRALASVILSMGILQSSFPWVSSLSPQQLTLASQLSTGLQLLITFAVVQLYFTRLREQFEASHLQLEQQLAKALDDFIPLCMGCKNVRVEDGPWQTLEDYLSDRTGSKVSHGLCPSCLPRLYPDIAGRP